MDELGLSLCLVTDRAQTRGRDLIALVEECLAAGLPAVQVREKDLASSDLAVLCRRLRGPTRARGALLIVNDRADVALAVGADAVQRTHASLPVEDLKALGDKRLLVGASVHSLDEAKAAEAAGADWVTFGPIYDTPSKRPFGPPQGLEALETIVRAVSIPVVAIGGITPGRVRAVMRTGVAGVAIISAILAADSPGHATEEILGHLK
ncbi:MAG: thiamine phosphate synthase [Candidatus Rokubacteria bacterium]|nr:thiamine phosphate synthase [Candidatus Rokubacteria bacterium]